MTAIVVTQIVTISRSIYPSCQTQDLISNRPPCDFRSDIGDNSWKLNAKNWRNTGRKDISPLALQYVHTVETEGSNLLIRKKQQEVGTELLTYLNQNFLAANWRLRGLTDVETICSTGPTFD